MIDTGLTVLSCGCEGGHDGDGGIAHACLLLLLLWLVLLGCRDIVHGEEIKVRADGRERRLCVGTVTQTATAATNGTVTKERTLEVIKLLHQLEIRQFLLKLCIGLLRQGRGLLGLLNERDWGRSDIHVMDDLSLLLVVVVESRRRGRGWGSAQTDASHFVLKLLMLLLLVGKLELLLLLLLTQDVIDIEDLLVNGWF